MGELAELEELRDRYAVFEDRLEAGRRLSEFLRQRGVRFDSILAIPNGGVAVGYALALELGAPLSVAVVRKLTYPWTTEAGFGAVSWLGDLVVDEAARSWLGEPLFESCLERAKRSVEERVRVYRDFLPEELRGCVLLVDDGLATGYTMLAAIAAARRLRAEKVLAAVPTASIAAANMVAERVDLLAVLNLRTQLPYAVADAYRVWTDLTDAEVLQMLQHLRGLGLA
ncbi:MAG: phosphoribosyltransferase family protein [Thermofilaceae archaeon]